jgi:hypothetical protein
MQNITSVAEIKNAIQVLEAEQAAKGELLKEQFYITYESLRPVNFLKSIVKDLSSSPYMIENILGSAVGLASGYVSKKIVVGASSNIVRRLMGSILQFGVTNLVAQHPDAIKAFGQFLAQHIFHKKYPNAKDLDK